MISQPYFSFGSASEWTTVLTCHQSYLQGTSGISPTCAFPPLPLPASGKPPSPRPPLTFWPQQHPSLHSGQGAWPIPHHSLLSSRHCPLFSLPWQSLLRSHLQDRAVIWPLCSSVPSSRVPPLSLQAKLFLHLLCFQCWKTTCPTFHLFLLPRQISA